MRSLALDHRINHGPSLAFIHEMKSSGGEFQSTRALGSAVAEEDDTEATGAFLASLARQNLSVLMRAIQRIEQYWVGMCFISNVLEQRAAGVRTGPEGRNSQTDVLGVAGLGYSRIDPSPKGKKTFISLPDKGLLRRFTGEKEPDRSAVPAQRLTDKCGCAASVTLDRTLPHNTAPPTETSLRDSVARAGPTASMCTSQLPRAPGRDDQG
jgi:hypothetical protein